MNTVHMASDHPPIAELLIRAREKIRALSESLQEVVDPATISTTVKVPFKLLCFREALSWRTEELARTALACLERKEFAAGALLTRGVTESAAAVWYLKNLMDQHIKEPMGAKELDKKAMALLLGHKLKEVTDGGAPVAINILSMVDRVDRDIPGFRKSYDALSEAAHPNWRGTAGLFSQMDSDRILTRFGPNIRSVDFFEAQGLGLLVGSLGTFEIAYNQVSELMPDFIAACEALLEPS